MFAMSRVGRDSVVGIATGWKARGSNSSGAWFSGHIQTGPGVHPASYTVIAGSVPRVKLPRRGFDHPPSTSEEVKEGVEL
jgi:hypothetical protein